MKLLFVTQFFPGPREKAQTGGTISNRNFLLALARSADVTVLSFDHQSAAEAFVDEPYKVIHRPAPNWRAMDLVQHWQNFVRDETRAVFTRSGTPQILFATTSTVCSFDVCPPQTRSCAIIRAYENFGFRCAFVPWPSRVKLAKLQMVRRFRDAASLRKADAVLTNSAFMRHAIEKRFGIPERSIHVLSQKVDVSPTKFVPPQNSIGFVHRGSDKNIALVIEIARIAPDLTFHIYGHPNDLPKALPSNVVLEGWRSDRSSMFASAALWLVPSLWAEPFGRVSIEAQAANRAVLVADRGGLPETVLVPEFKIAGYNTNAWLARMRSLLELTPEALERNGAEIRLRFSETEHDRAIGRAVTAITSKKDDKCC